VFLPGCEAFPSRHRFEVQPEYSSLGTRTLPDDGAITAANASERTQLMRYTRYFFSGDFFVDHHSLPQLQTHLVDSLHRLHTPHSNITFVSLTSHEHQLCLRDFWRNDPSSMRSDITFYDLRVLSNPSASQSATIFDHLKTPARPCELPLAPRSVPHSLPTKSINPTNVPTPSHISLFCLYLLAGRWPMD
jgi:hypothetical protein